MTQHEALMELRNAAKRAATPLHVKIQKLSNMLDATHALYSIADEENVWMIRTIFDSIADQITKLEVSISNANSDRWLNLMMWDKVGRFMAEYNAIKEKGQIIDEVLTKPFKMDPPVMVTPVNPKDAENYYYEAVIRPSYKNKTLHEKCVVTDDRKNEFEEVLIKELNDMIPRNIITKERANEKINEIKSLIKYPRNDSVAHVNPDVELRLSCRRSL